MFSKRAARLCTEALLQISHKVTDLGTAFEYEQAEKEKNPSLRVDIYISVNSSGGPAETMSVIGEFFLGEGQFSNCCIQSSSNIVKTVRPGQGETGHSALVNDLSILNAVLVIWGCT